MNEVVDPVLKSLTDTYLDKITVDGNVLSEALSYDGEAMTNLSSQKLTALSYDLARFQIYLQLHYNVRVSNHLRAKRDFKILLGQALVKLPAKGTIAEKTTKALELDPKLAELEEEVANTEREEALFKDVPKQISELINSIKKELSRREGH